MAQMRKIITLGERNRQLSTILRFRDIQKLISILEDYETCGEFPSEFYDCLYELCDRHETDDEILTIMLSCKKFDVNKKHHNGETIVHALIRNNHFEWVQYLLKMYLNIDVNAACTKKRTPFLLAAEYGHVEVMELLEPLVEDIHCCDYKKFNALHWMAKHGNLKWVKYLIEEKAFAVNQKNSYGDTPLNRAIAFGHYECTQYLLKMGLSLTETDIDGRTLLHTAVFGENVKCLDALLELSNKESFVNFKDNNGKTALNLAASRGFKEMVISLLKANADVNHREPDGRTALVGAAIGGYGDIVKLLIDAKAIIDDDNEKKFKPLTWAVSKGHMGIVKILLEAGANVNATGEFGMTALDWASQGNETMVNYLLQHEKINVNSNSSIGGHTPLMRAAKRGMVDIVRALIRANANVDIQNSCGMTALLLAVANGELQCVIELIKGNANLDLKDNRGDTALIIAKRLRWNGDIIMVLEQELSLRVK